MAATSLKLPDTLKRRIARLAASARQSPHAFMVEALTREAERAELRVRFGAEAAQSEREALASGTAYGLAATFDYLSARASGKPARRPRPHRWRASK
jgi:predicted transcriptional regulator